MLKKNFTAVVTGLCVWEVNRIIIWVIRQRFPKLEQTFKRFLWTVFFEIICTALVCILLTSLEDVTGYWTDERHFEDYWSIIAQSTAFSLIITVAYDGVFIFQNWRQTWMENLQLKRAMIQTQIDGLRERVNPHFLFNSLNALSALIVEDKQQAGRFVDELSSVYRYALQSYDTELVTLDHELAFVESYFFLLETRFGKAIEIKIEVDEGLENKKLPPNTLQILIDNALKHNIVSEKTPLSIFIKNEGSDRLLVINSIKKKKITVTNKGKQLEHLKRKFRLMNLPDVTVEETETFFKVKIPI